MASKFRLVGAAVFCSFAVSSTLTLAASRPGPSGVSDHASRPSSPNKTPVTVAKNAYAAVRDKIPARWRGTVLYGTPAALINGAAAVAFVRHDPAIAAHFLVMAVPAETGAVVHIPNIDQRVTARIQNAKNQVSRWVNGKRPQPPAALTQPRSPMTGTRSRSTLLP
jgi:hypothetical protein